MNSPLNRLLGKPTAQARDAPPEASDVSLEASGWSIEEPAPEKRTETRSVSKRVEYAIPSSPAIVESIPNGKM